MQRSDEVFKTKFGRQVTIRQDIKPWRKRKKRYEKLKALILAYLATLPKEEAVTWLNTPRDGRMLGRTPKEMFHPRRISVLYLWMRKQGLLTKCSTV